MNKVIRAKRNGLIFFSVMEKRVGIQTSCSVKELLPRQSEFAIIEHCNRSLLQPDNETTSRQNKRVVKM